LEPSATRQPQFRQRCSSGGLFSRLSGEECCSFPPERAITIPTAETMNPIIPPTRASPKHACISPQCS
jgi:hypothetical protein